MPNTASWKDTGPGPLYSLDLSLGSFLWVRLASSLSPCHASHRCGCSGLRCVTPSVSLSSCLSSRRGSFAWICSLSWASRVTLAVKKPLANAGDLKRHNLIPGSGRSHGGGNGNPLQYSCLENPTDRKTWQATVHGVTESWLQLSDWAHSTDVRVICNRLKENYKSLEGFFCSSIVSQLFLILNLLWRTWNWKW